MITKTRSVAPTIVLRISDGTSYMHRSFTDFSQAVRSAEAFSGAGYSVSVISATGRFLMRYEAKSRRATV